MYICINIAIGNSNNNKATATKKTDLLVNGTRVTTERRKKIIHFQTGGWSLRCRPLATFQFLGVFFLNFQSFFENWSIDNDCYQLVSMYTNIYIHTIIYK